VTKPIQQRTQQQILNDVIARVRVLEALPTSDGVSEWMLSYSTGYQTTTASGNGYLTSFEHYQIAGVDTFDSAVTTLYPVILRAGVYVVQQRVNWLSNVGGATPTNSYLHTFATDPVVTTALLVEAQNTFVAGQYGVNQFQNALSGSVVVQSSEVGSGVTIKPFYSIGNNAAAGFQFATFVCRVGSTLEVEQSA
jgi:hypothetical protein